MQQILDLHIHSKYSRACSKNLELPSIARACETRGIDIVATGDFTHPGWFAHMKERLVEDIAGVFKLRIPNTNNQTPSKTRFIIGTELSCIKKHKDKTRRVHVLVFAPSLEVAEKFNKTLDDRGFNLKSDGRPILGLTCKQLLEIMLEVDEHMVMIPAHAWTPWFGIFGSKGGYDSLEEAFEELAPHIFAIETGLSSDPIMNWRLSALDNITLISNSDAHSPAKLGREANVFKFKNNDEITYDRIFEIIKQEDKEYFSHTIEFYPEEGKYHWDGHRDCKFSCSPEETEKYKGACPKCKKKMIIGVENRVHELADRNIEEAQKAGEKKIPYKSLVPLVEIIADTVDKGWNTKTVSTIYNKMISDFDNEFHILQNVSLGSIKESFGKKIASAVERVRKGNIYIKPGYDGEFGVVKVFFDSEDVEMVKQIQMGLELD
ncbi:MAG: DNA helicase UvrD [Candidatus Magasanikbacteria bacterium CG_4_10_14_0_2_um_filter_37_12]|uniref:DNA helicase UvrD n=1 Tax=Candidatus Magasanikbacteria bacterium CG_4_10_14_0_2_um_filter_37_12 TaxID=1974637 RepID=A0A2M7V7U1_9BACT|nr:MAG: DNA helicase UvrD [Candidatus Magasanikbacteria bacterium CG_4_10_14_0_2_um_filter_37_12]